MSEHEACVGTAPTGAVASKAAIVAAILAMASAASRDAVAGSTRLPTPKVTSARLIPIEGQTKTWRLAFTLEADAPVFISAQIQAMDRMIEDKKIIVPVLAPLTVRQNRGQEEVHYGTFLWLQDPAKKGAAPLAREVPYPLNGKVGSYLVALEEAIQSKENFEALRDAGIIYTRQSGTTGARETTCVKGSYGQMGCPEITVLLGRGTDGKEDSFHVRLGGESIAFENSPAWGTRINRNRQAQPGSGNTNGKVEGSAPSNASVEWWNEVITKALALVENKPILRRTTQETAPSGGFFEESKPGAFDEALRQDGISVPSLK